MGANTLTFSTEIDGSGFAKGIAAMEMRMEAANKRLSSTVLNARNGNADPSKSYVDFWKPITEARIRDDAMAKIHSQNRLKEALEQRRAQESLTRAQNEALGIRSGSEVTRTTHGMTERLAVLRRELTSGSKMRVEAARTEIQALKRLQTSSPVFSGGAGVGGKMAMANTMFISAARDSMASLATGANPLTVFLQQAPQIAQAFTMMKGSAVDFFKTLITMPIGPLGAAAGIIAGIVAGLASAYYFASALTKRLTGLQMPDFRPEYIAKRLQSFNQVAESGRKAGETIRGLVEDYNSAASAAARLSDETKKHYNHLRQLNTLKNANNPGLQAKEEARINEDERQSVIKNKQSELKALRLEQSQKKRAADNLSRMVPVEHADDEKIRKAKADADVGRKYLEEASQFNDEDIFSKRNMLRRMNKISNTGVSDADVVAADKKQRDDAVDAVAREKAAIENKANNDMARERLASLRKQEEAAMTGATKLNQEIPELIKQSAADKAREQELLSINPRQGRGGSSIRSDSLTSVGNFLGSSKNMVESMIQKQVHILTQIERNTRRGQGGKSGFSSY